MPGNDISKSISFIHSQFVRGVCSQSKTDVALFVDQNTLDSTSIVGNCDGVGVLYQHVFLPYFGGPDDRLALDFVVQICANCNGIFGEGAVLQCQTGILRNRANRQH
jgi:hypothetical protein